MNHFAVFFNHRVHAYTSPSNFSGLSVKLGDWCLTPVRCLFNGNEVSILYRNNTVNLFSSKEYSNSTFGIDKRPKRNVWRVVASIILLIPGLIIGSAFKGLGYLSPSIRAHHQLVIQHYTPVDHTLGSREKGLDLDEINQRLIEIKNNNHLKQPIRNLVIYIKKGTEITSKNLGIDFLGSPKLTLIRAQDPNHDSFPKSLFGQLGHH